MPVVDRTAVRASRNIDIRGYGSRIAFAALTRPGRRGCCIRVCRFNWSNNNFKYDSAISRRDSPEVCKSYFASLRIEGAGNAGRSMRPQPRMQNKTKHTSIVTTVTPEITRHSPRNGFTAYFALSPVTTLV